MSGVEHEHEIRTALARYLAKELTLEEFVESSVPLAWAVPTEEGGIGDLVREVELRLAEYSSRGTTEVEMCTRLARLLRRYPVSLPTASLLCSTRAETSSRAHAVAWPVRTSSVLRLTLVQSSMSPAGR